MLFSRHVFQPFIRQNSFPQKLRILFHFGSVVCSPGNGNGQNRTGVILEWDGKGIGVIQEWDRSDTGMRQEWNKNETGMEQEWNGNRTGVIQEWDRSDTGMKQE